MESDPTTQPSRFYLTIFVHNENKLQAQRAHDSDLFDCDRRESKNFVF